jgi:lipoyl(octanoyl) transferase
MAVEDVGRFVRTMEAAIISALAEEGVEARARPEDGADYTGVWVQERKIASIGVHVRRGIATHGFAVNVCNDLDPFTWIVPCGLQGVAMTSLSLESPAACSMACFRRRSAHAFAEAHERRQRLVSPWRLRRAAADPSGRAARRAPLEIDRRRLGTVPA